MKKLKKLPIGYSSFERIRDPDENCVYIDKTQHVVNLVENGRYYFLARPRRFGKSLFIDTLKQAFLGNRQLFTELYLEKYWDFNKTYPVIHLDFSGGVLANREQLESKINQLLNEYYDKYQIVKRYTDSSDCFGDLIDSLASKYQMPVVILIDEYDKPILDNIDNQEIALANREGLKNLYSVIKAKDAKLKFVLLTGVTKFNKVGLFSGLNNLEDITLDGRYADICGYTQDELEHAFTEYLANVDQKKLKYWYNGYNFIGNEKQKVYNPFDILLFFAKGCEYRSYWFATGSPMFLLRLLQSRRYYLPNVEKMIVGEEVFDSFDIDNIGIETLLFQAGYLTIGTVQHDNITDCLNYELVYPNFEVRKGMSSHLVKYFMHDEIAISTFNQQLTKALTERDFAALPVIFKQFFASIPYNWYVKNDIANYEGFYAVVVYSLFNGLGVVAIPEDATNKGRIDLTINLPEYIILLEFKLSTQGDAQSALQQLKDRKYAAKYTTENKPIYLLGMSFDPDARSVVDFAYEEIIN